MLPIMTPACNAIVPRTEKCWANAVPDDPRTGECGKDAVRLGLCKDCFYEIFGEPVAGQGS